MSMCMFLHEVKCTLYAHVCPQKTKENAGSPETTLTGPYAHPMKLLETEPRFFASIVSALNQ